MRATRPTRHGRSPLHSDATRRDPPLRSAVKSVLESAFVQAPIGMALVDMAGRTLQVNEALCRITGYPAERVCGRPFRRLCGPYNADVDASQKLDLLEGPPVAMACCTKG